MKVLLIDDDAVNLKIEEAFLFQVDLGLEVDAISNYNEAIKKIDAIDYGLYITDYRLDKGMSALDIIKKIKHDRQKGPILVITAIDDEENFRKLQEAGADEFLVKGEITISLLRRTILKLKRWNLD